MSKSNDKRQEANKRRRLLDEQGEVEKERVDTEEKDAYDKSKFDHVFSGLSVWLEFETHHDVDNEMKQLQKPCGGEECGVYSFVNHVTILYNIDKNRAEGEILTKTAEETLKECCKKIQSKDIAVEDKTLEQNENSKDESLSPTISASNWMYFHYPKSADDGKGFGCSISLLLIEKSPWLERLHKVCADAFGHGERDKFIPHLSLVYAPEDREKFLVEYTEKQRNKGLFLKETFPVKFVSLWSTEGRVCNWRPILKIPI